MWEFYLLASKYSFVNMGNVVFQIQIAKILTICLSQEIISTTKQFIFIEFPRQVI